MRKIITILLLLTAILLAGCGAAPADNTGAQTESVVVPEGHRVVTDQAGRQVVLPQEVKSAALIYGPTTNFLLALGVADRLVAVNATWGFYNLVEPALANVGTVGQGYVDLEMLARYRPDVFLHRAGDDRTIKAVEELGIPVVCIWPESTEDLKETIRVLGETFGVPERAAELIAYYDSKVEAAAAMLAQVPPEEYKSAIVMGTEIGRVAHGGMLQSFMLRTAGAVNCAEDVESVQTWPLVGAETIFAWDPEYIFCTNSKASVYKVEDIMTDPVWSEMQAVRDGHVLLVPSDVDSWEFPGMASCLGFLWMLSQMYPEIYSEEEFLTEVDAFYQFVYGMTFSREYLGY